MKKNLAVKLSIRRVRQCQMHSNWKKHYHQLIWYFTSVAKQIEEKLIKPKHQCSKYLQSANYNFFFITHTNNEVKNNLKNNKDLKNNKSSGHSSIPITFLKLLQAAPSKPISLIVNLSFSAGISPANQMIIPVAITTVQSHYFPI